MNRQAASLLIVAPFEENERMYPHLHDALVNLREYYDEVHYLYDSRGYQDRIAYDRLLYQVQATRNPHEQLALQQQLEEAARVNGRHRNAFLEELSKVRFRHSRRLVVAVDDNAFNCAMEVFPESTVYWSFDPLGTDCMARLFVDGSIEEMIHENSRHARNARALIVQDSEREQHLTECLGQRFGNILYVPVALNDDRFSRIGALKRVHGGNPNLINVVQCGYVWAGRYSDELLRAYQSWPDVFRLHLRGDIGLDIRPLLEQSNRPVQLTRDFLETAALPAMLTDYDVGFVGYREADRNHHLIVNASSQLVMYLRSGMPVICCGSEQLVSFVNTHGIGIGAASPGQITPGRLAEVAENYARYSANARSLYERAYDLRTFMPALFSGLDALMPQKGPA